MCSERPPRLSVHQVLWCPDHLSPTPSNSSTIKTPNSRVEDPDDPTAAYDRYIQIESSSDQLYSPSIGAANKKLPVRP